MVSSCQGLGKGGMNGRSIGGCVGWGSHSGWGFRRGSMPFHISETHRVSSSRPSSRVSCGLGGGAVLMRVCRSYRRAGPVGAGE